MSSDQPSVLLYVEAEAFVESLVQFELVDVGNERWNQQHEKLEKLNIQAALNASLQNDEFIKDCLISADKVGLLIHELLAIEVWKEKVFPEFTAIQFQPKVTFPLYMALYHEATVINLLETIMFHREVCEAAGDALVDLVDYCQRKLAYLISRDKDEALEDKVATEASNLEELNRQKETLKFDIAIKAVSVVNYITDNLSELPLSVMTRMLNTLDFPVLLVQLMETAPWTRSHKREISKLIDGKWKQVSYEDSLKLTKTEGQVWLALYQLLMKAECMKKYELSQSRKCSILKLRAFLSEVILDQIPALVEMRRYLEHLSVVDPPQTQSAFILEQVPEIREALLRSGSGRWKSIAKKQAKAHFDVSPDSMRQHAKRLADTYNMEQLEGLLVDPAKCAVCGNQAPKRCSRCHNEWYCRRECQVQHWSKHKQVCGVMAEALKATTGSVA